MSMVEPGAGKGAARVPSGAAETGLSPLGNAAENPVPTPGTPVAQRRGAAGRQGKSLLREMLETLLLTAVLFLIARATVQPFRVDGHSMDPTLHDSEFILVDKISYKIGQPARGDIVVFHYPGDTTRDFIKRVIGLPGDTISVRHQRVYVNNTPLNEAYLPSGNAPAYDFAPYTVKKGDLFVLGDNRNNSYDSHTWGIQTPLHDNLVIGKALLAYWPLQDFAFYSRPSYNRVR